MNKEAKKQFDEVLAKPIGMLNEFDVAILRARRSYLSAKQIEDYSEVLKEKEEKKKVIEVGAPPVGTGKSPIVKNESGKTNKK